MDGLVERCALDALAIGVLVTDPEARLIYANAAADDLLGRSAAGLGRCGDRVFARDARIRTELRKAIGEACDGMADAGHYLLAPGKGDVDLAVCVLPMARMAVPVPGQAMLVVRPIDRDCNVEIEARRLFGLTRGEARIASSIAAGLSLQEAAERHDVTLATVRSHMKRIYSKTGVGQQSQVAALLRGAQVPVRAPRVASDRPSGPRPGQASQIHRLG